MTIVSYLAALGATLALELIVASACRLRKRDLLLVIAANLITHPLLHLILLVGSIFIPNMKPIIPFLEGGVVFAEYCLLRNISGWRQGHIFLLSLAMNSISYFIGLGFYAIIGLLRL